MSEPPLNGLSEEERDELARAWNDALISKEKMTDPVTKALVGGFNLRIDLVKSLKAAWKTAQLMASVGKAVATQFANPLDYFKIPADVFATIQAGLDAVREPMSPLAYTACLVLSGEPRGLTAAELQERLGTFLNSGAFGQMPWYLRLTADGANEAKVVLQQPNGFENLLKMLRADQWLIEEGDRIRLAPRHFSLGWKLG